MTSNRINKSIPSRRSVNLVLALLAAVLPPTAFCLLPTASASVPAVVTGPCGAAPGSQHDVQHERVANQLGCQREEER